MGKGIVLKRFIGIYALALLVSLLANAVTEQGSSGKTSLNWLKRCLLAVLAYCLVPISAAVIPRIGQSLLFLMFLLGSANAYAAPTPYACDGVPYTIIDSPSTMQSFDTATLAVTNFPAMTPSGTNVNGIGFNNLDNFIYGIRSGAGGGFGNKEIIRIGANSEAEGLGIPTYTGAGSVAWAPQTNNGTFDTAGNYYILSKTHVYKVNVGTNPTAGGLTFTAVARTGITSTPNDITFSIADGNLYGASSAGLLQINPNTGSTTSVTYTGTLGAAGGAWSTASDLYFYSNGGGILYVVSGIGSGTPVAAVVGNTTANPDFDATTCIPPSLKKYASVATAAAGSSFDYTYTIINPYIVSLSLDFADILPANLTYDLSSLTPPGGGTVTTFNSTDLNISNITIAANSQISFTVTVNVDAGTPAGEIDNQATIIFGSTTLESDDPDTNDIDDPTTVTITASAASPASPDVPLSCQAASVTGIAPDGLPDFAFPRGYWAASYFKGFNGNNNAPGNEVFQGEAFWGLGANPFRLTVNGSHSSGRWSNAETPTSPLLHHSSYTGNIWTDVNPAYQIDYRSTMQVGGVIRIGGDPGDVVDDTIEIYVNGTRQYAYFPGGGAPNPRPTGTIAAVVPVSAGDKVLVRFINLGYIGGMSFEFEAPGYDCSDAPSSYGGPSHETSVNTTLYLGATVDVDSTDISSVGATADGADDDGVSIPALTQGASASIPVTINQVAANDGYLQGWIDWNGDGTFGAGEQVATDLQLASGTNGTISVPVTVPAGATTSQTFARFRWSTTSGLDTTTAANDGEVEDYAITISQTSAIVSGRVYIDANSNASDDSEVGIGGTVVVLRDTLTNTCQSVKTNSNGDYAFLGVLDSGFELYQAHNETTPVPQSCGSASASNPTGYQSTTADVISLIVFGSDVTDRDFGEVAGITFEPNHQSEVLPGNTTFYAHTLTTEADGAVMFTAADSGNATSGWTHTLYRDSDCNGSLNGTEGNAVIIGINLGVSAGGRLCIIDKVYAPANVPAQDRYEVKTTATFTFAGGTVAPATLEVTDLTISGQTETPTSPETGASRLELTKTVENLTQTTPETETVNQANPGDLLKYRFYYHNVGTAPITDLKINDTVPPFTGFVGSSNSCDITLAGMTCTPTINIDELNWNFTGPLIGGASGHVSYEVMVDN
jgi:uncharacterized repeat protein (TIGR01451 family)